jgi:RHS repeat-associated protein
VGDSFTANGGTTTYTDPAGNIETEKYVNGELMSVTRGVGTNDEGTWHFTYDPSTLGRTNITNPMGDTWSTTFDAHGNPLTSTTPPTSASPHGATTTTTYNQLDEPLSVTGPDGVAHTFTYDDNGNLLSEARPLVGSGTSRTTYDHEGASPSEVTRITDPDGHSWHYTYDAHGHLETSTNPNGETWSFVYDRSGRVLSETTPRGNSAGATAADFTYKFAYNAAGQLSKQIDPLGGTTTYDYDDAGRNFAITDSEGHRTVTAFNAVGEAIRVTQADGTVTSTNYTSTGLPSSRTNGLGEAITYSYDALSRLVQKKDALGRATTFAYDQADHMVSETDPAGNTTAFSYDAAGEQTGITYSDETAPVTFSYDVNGLRIGMTDGTGSSTYRYDSLGRLISKQDGAGLQVQYDYDLSGNVTRLTYPNGKSIRRAFDSAGRLAQVTDWNDGTSRFDYDPDGNLTTITYPNGVVETRSYDTLGMIDRLRDRVGSRTLADYSYRRDTNSNVTSAAASGPVAGPSESYTYSALNQLKGYSSGSTTSSYTYDAAGDPTQLADGTTLSYERGQQLATSTAPDGAVTRYTRDPLGNLTGIDTPDGSQTHLAFDQANRLTRYNTPTDSARYIYDGAGQRTAKTVNGTTSRYVYDNQTGEVPLLLFDGTRSYVYGADDLPIEQIGSGEASIKLVGTATAIDESPGKAASMTVRFTAPPRANDQILLIINCASNQQPAVPAGYTPVTEVKSANSAEVTVIYRRTATGSELDARVTFVNGNPPHPKTLTGLIYRGVDPSQPIDGLTSAISAGRQSAITAAAVSTTANNDQIVLVENALDTPANSKWASPEGMTTRATVGNSRVISAVADRPVATPSSTGPLTARLDHEAQLEVVALALRGGAGTQYFQHDHHGSTRILTAADGSVSATYSYNPYGETTSHTGSAETPLCYDGQYKDTETGYYYLQARYYDPAIAQFITRDPLDDQTGAPFQYAADNPINIGDPLGLAAETDKLTARSHKAYLFFRMFYAPIQAAAIVGNLMTESAPDDGSRGCKEGGVSPHCTDDATAWGIAQWDSQRWKRLLRFEGGIYREHPTGLCAQLDFVFNELENPRFRSDLADATKLDDFFNATSLDDATLAFMNAFEGPGFPQAKRRQRDAELVYAIYHVYGNE